MSWSFEAKKKFYRMFYIMSFDSMRRYSPGRPVALTWCDALHVTSSCSACRQRVTEAPLGVGEVEAGWAVKVQDQFLGELGPKQNTAVNSLLTEFNSSRRVVKRLKPLRGDKQASVRQTHHSFTLLKFHCFLLCCCVLFGLSSFRVIKDRCRQLSRATAELGRNNLGRVLNPKPRSQV